MESKCCNTKYICHNFQSGVADIRTRKQKAGEIIEEELTDSLIAVVLDGSSTISFDKYLDETVVSGQAVFLPKGTHYKATVNEDTEILSIRVRDRMEFCERYSIEWLNADKDIDSQEFYKLDLNSELSDYVAGILKYVGDGIRCRSFLNLKIKELFFLLRMYYTRQELAKFFNPVVSSDQSFAEFIFGNYHKYRTVQELAEASCHSLSAFNKIFRKTFGTSPYHWMQEQRTKRIFYDINLSDKSLKEIASDHGFNSLSQFSNFCKSQFGISPRRLRESACPGEKQDSLSL